MKFKILGKRMVCSYNAAAPARFLKSELVFIMNLTAILLTVCSLNLSAAGYSQKNTLSENIIRIKPEANKIHIDVAPPVIVTGKVTDSKGETLIGVGVVVKGTTTGTSTDINGNFSITVPEDNSILVFSYLGFETQDVAVNSRTSINLVLKESSSALSEVVVTALGISREAKSLTYSAQKVDGEELTKATGTNVITGLQGKVAGLTITRGSGGVGATSTVLLRGNRSITGNNAPLYVTDGVPGAIGMEDSDNIESITVLKGAAAAALYGSAGQNGVILITTKRGKTGETTVRFNGGVLLDEPDVLIEFQDQYGQGDAGVFVASSEHSFGPKMTGQNVTLYNGKTVPLTAQPNSFRDYFRTGVTYNNSVNVTSGSEKMQTYFSYGNIRANGIMQNNDLNRHNINLRLNNNISKKLSIDTKLTYNYQKVNNVPNQYSLTSIFRTPVSIPTSEMSNFEYVDAAGNPRQSYWKPGSSIIGNPYFYMYRNLNYNDVHRAVGLVAIKYNFSKAISFQLRGNVNQTFNSSDTRIYQDSYHSLVGSTFTMNDSRMLNSNLDGLLTFKKDLTKKINLSGHVGGYVQGSNTVTNTANAQGLNKQDFFYMSNARAPLATNVLAKSPLIQSIYSSLTLAYNNYLYLDVTGRNDWSSALPPGEESVFYPSVGLTAIISDMVKLPSWVSYGKVRLSSASSGFGGDAYLGQEYYTVSTGGGIITPTIKAPGNYKPELTTSYEAGLDWRFLKDRLGVDLTFYKTKTTNQLLLIGIPTATLFDQKYINAGLIENKGVELLLNATPLKIGKFSWDATLNYSKNVNEIVRITDQMNSIILQDDGRGQIRVETGKSFGTVYVKGWQRDAQGRKLVDNLGRPLLTAGNSVFVGNANPDFMAGMTNRFNYNNISLGFQLDYRKGGILSAGTQPLMDADGHSKRSLLGREGGIVLDAYRVDGTKNTATITSQQYWSAIGDRYPTGEEYAYSGTNLRLRELTLDYKIPTRLLGKTKYVKGASISFVGRNLHFFQRSAPFDPDVARGKGGTEYVDLPFTRTYGFNLKASF
jgi:TonB-linked SusC/RagA family outer membrane protein